MNNVIELRAKVVNALISKYFKLNSPLQAKVNPCGVLQYINTNIVVFDCLFFLRVITEQGIFEVNQTTGLRKIK